MVATLVIGFEDFKKLASDNKRLYYFNGSNFYDFCFISDGMIIKTTLPKEAVKNPTYYGGVDNPYEVIKVCEAWGLDKDAYLFNVVKYVARAGKKDPQKELEDLKKAVFYLERKVKNIQK
jgi:hypothetical protein